jgi:hypothetical protein
VLQAIAAQGQRREQQVARPQRQAQRADLAERDVGERVRQALRADAERRLEERAELEGGRRIRGQRPELDSNQRPTP